MPAAHTGAVASLDRGEAAPPYTPKPMSPGAPTTSWAPVSRRVGDWVVRLARVRDVALFREGKQLRYPAFRQADEVQIVVRASKTDPEGETATRNLYKSGSEVCPVLATARYMTLLWEELGEPAPATRFFPHLSRHDIQEVLQTVAASMGEEPQAYTPHSLRFGGASAMWAGGFDSHVLRAWGRWNSDGRPSLMSS